MSEQVHSIGTMGKILVRRNWNATIVFRVVDMEGRQYFGTENEASARARYIVLFDEEPKKIC